MGSRLLIPGIPSLQDIFISNHIQGITAPLLIWCFVWVFFFSCPLRACLNSWRWWMRVKNTLQVGFGYNLSWEGGEDEGIRGGIEGGMVYRWAWGVGEVGARMFVFQWAVTLRERGGESGMRGERRVTGEEGRESISIQRRYHVLTESLRINCWLTYSQSNLQQSTFCMYVYLIEISSIQF